MELNHSLVDVNQALYQLTNHPFNLSPIRFCIITDITPIDQSQFFLLVVNTMELQTTLNSSVSYTIFSLCQHYFLKNLTPLDF